MLNKSFIAYKLNCSYYAVNKVINGGVLRDKTLYKKIKSIVYYYNALNNKKLSIYDRRYSYRKQFKKTYKRYREYKKRYRKPKPKALKILQDIIKQYIDIPFTTGIIIPDKHFIINLYNYIGDEMDYIDNKDMLKIYKEHRIFLSNYLFKGLDIKDSILKRYKYRADIIYYDFLTVVGGRDYETSGISENQFFRYKIKLNTDPYYKKDNTEAFNRISEQFSKNFKATSQAFAYSYVGTIFAYFNNIGKKPEQMKQQVKDKKVNKDKKINKDKDLGNYKDYF